MHLCAEIDLKVFCIVQDVEEGAALVKLGDAEGERERERAHSEGDSEDTKEKMSHGRMNEAFLWVLYFSCCIFRTDAGGTRNSSVATKHYSVINLPYISAIFR